MKKEAIRIAFSLLALIIGSFSLGSRFSTGETIGLYLIVAAATI